MNPDELPRIAQDPQAFESFYRAHVERVRRFVARRIADPYLAADVTADVFMASIDAAPGYRRDRGTPTGWLFGVARIVVAAEYRRASRESRANARLEGRRLLADDDDIERMQERIDAASGSRALFAAVAQLPEGERAVLELVALDGLSVGEAGRALGIGAVAARVRLHRARRRLRSRLDLLDLDTNDLPEVTT
jgi:RNA polymerase sigma factor (sigma-70 family)